MISIKERAEKTTELYVASNPNILFKGYGQYAIKQFKEISTQISDGSFWDSNYSQDKLNLFMSMLEEQAKERLKLYKKFYNAEKFLFKSNEESEL